MDNRLVYLSQWILSTVTAKVPAGSQFTTRMAAKRFIQFNGPNDMNVDCTPLVRMLTFCKTTHDGELTGIVHDETHKILCKFSKECIRKFECDEAQRLTYQTVGCLFIIRKANLRFLHLSEALEEYGDLPGLQLCAGLSLCFLDVTEVEVFMRHPLQTTAKYDLALRYIYMDNEYVDRFGWSRDGSRDAELTQIDRFYQGGMLSHEDLPASASCI